MPAALKDLIHILERNKSEELQAWITKNKGTHQGNLYHGILKDRYKTDKEACDDIYGKGSETGKYRKLKGDLRNNLENLVVFLKVKPKMANDAEYESAMVNKDFAIFNNLIIGGGNLCVVDKGERLYERALAVGKTLIAATTAKMLIGRGAIKQDKEKFDKYVKHVEELSKVLKAEDLGAIYTSTAQTWSRKTKASLKKRVPEIEVMFEKYKEALGDLSSPFTKYYEFTLELYIHSAANNHTKTLEVAERGLAYFEKLPFVYPSFLKSFNYYVIIQRGYIKDYEQANIYGQLNLSWLTVGTTSWFKTLELLTYAALRSGNYEAATTHWHEATKHPFFADNSDAMMRDIFKIYFSQIKMMQESGVYLPSEKYSAIFKDKFRVSTFKNDLELAEKDKSGLNIAILFADIIFQVLRGQFDDIEIHFEATQKYLQRYAQEEGDSRVYQYAKLVEGGIRVNWDYKKMQGEEFAKILAYMGTLESSAMDSRFEFEVITYEELWEFTIVQLEAIAKRKQKK